MVQMEKRETIGIDLISILINGQTATNNNYLEMQAYYEGIHSILDRKVTDTNQPNNKLVNNFPGYIVDVSLGYFMGKPVAYNSLNDALMEALQDILDTNDEADENIELAKKAGIKGTAYELLYMDEDSNIRFGVSNPENIILVYDNSINPEPQFALRYYLVLDPLKPTAIESATMYVELYTTEKIYYYERKGSTGALLFTKEEAHQFGGVPVVEFPNNDERCGDFEKVLSLIDAYDLNQSNSANTFEYNDDAILKIKNMSGTNSDDLAKMKKQKAVLVEADGDVDWITKAMNDVAVENFKSRLQKDIHRFSNTPNLTDESFAGNLTGIALEFKLWGLEQNASQKERKFKRALQKRFELILNVLRVKSKEYDWRDINIIFTRNMPMNVPDLVEMVVKLKGIISDKTLFALLPFVEDPDEEIKLMAQDFDLDDDETDTKTDETEPEEEVVDPEAIEEEQIPNDQEA